MIGYETLKRKEENTWGKGLTNPSNNKSGEQDWDRVPLEIMAIHLFP